MAKTVLISSGRMPVALEVARSLKDEGFRVITVDTISRYICQSSNSVAESYVVPSPNDDFMGYQKAVLKIVEKEQVELILPMTEDVFFLSLLAQDLPASCELFASSHELLLELHHKQKFIEFAKRNGLKVPESHIYRDGEDLPAFTQNDYILKKVYSRAGTGVLFPSREERPETLGVPGDGSWLIQEKLKGKQYCSCTILHHGQIVAHVVYEPAVVNGTTSIVFREAFAPSIREWIETFADKTQFHGTVSFDFFVDHDGTARAIECNPRPTSGYHVMSRESLASALIHRKTAPTHTKKFRRAQILVPTLLAMPSLLRTRKIKDVFLEIFKARDVIFDTSDYIPLFYQILCAISVFSKSLRRGVPVTSCMMDGLEWNERPQIKAIEIGA